MLEPEVHVVLWLARYYCYEHALKLHVSNRLTHYYCYEQGTCLHVATQYAGNYKNEPIVYLPVVLPQAILLGTTRITLGSPRLSSSLEALLATLPANYLTGQRHTQNPELDQGVPPTAH
jgi:hypothetical protein